MYQISFVHPFKNSNARNAAIALSEAGTLREIVTTVAVKPGGPLEQIVGRIPGKMGAHIVSELSRRHWNSPGGEPVRTHPWGEVYRIAMVRSKLVGRVGPNVQAMTDNIWLSLDNHVARHHLDGTSGVYAYEDGAATTFRAAKERGIATFYDLPIPYYKTYHEIQFEEAARFPDLAESIHVVHEPSWKLERKDAEIELADHIFVASNLTKRSLVTNGVDPSKITLTPYGAPTDYFYPRPPTSDTADVDNVGFRALYVGRVGPRKGVHYLLQAWKELRLPSSELLLLGVNEFRNDWLSKYRDVFRHVPTVPHSSLNAYFSSANIVVFPSLAEGFGLVVVEAMACGIPVIATQNTCGADVITDGVDGFVVPIRDTEALKEKIDWCYRHPDDVKEMGRAARKKAESLTWSAYRATLNATIRAFQPSVCQ